MLEACQCVQVPRVLGSLEINGEHWIALELAPLGDVAQHLRCLGVFSWDRIKLYAAELVLFLETIHQRGIIHRDLKPSNLAFSADGHIKVLDLGLACFVSESKAKVSGTPQYMAPEVILGMAHSESSDIWSLGVCLFEMALGLHPFLDSRDLKATMGAILRTEPSFPFELERDCPDFVDLVKKMLEKHSSCRISLERIKRHPWFDSISWNHVLCSEAPKISTSLQSLYYENQQGFGDIDFTF
jgi:serine/threonine protein kinase